MPNEIKERALRGRLKFGENPPPSILQVLNEALHGKLLPDGYEIVSMSGHEDTITLKLKRQMGPERFIVTKNVLDEIKDIPDDVLDAFRAQQALAELKRRHAGESDWE